ncbi:MAG TPA: hypothetical protein VFD43_13225 [Planctomycetota bacterium]|nr:hypothetical protein [Planctomycetota bacterium]
MQRRPTLTQRDGLFSTTRFILYGNRVRVIRQSPLVRDDQYIPLAAVDPDRRVVRQPELRWLLLALVLCLPGAFAGVGWPHRLPLAATVATIALSALGFVVIGRKFWPGQAVVHHGALQLLADVPDPATFRDFESRLVSASRNELVAASEAGAAARELSVAAEIRRLHGHCRDGHLSSEAFGRQKLRLLASLREHIR